MTYSACRAFSLAAQNTLSRFYRSNERPCIVPHEVNCLYVILTSDDGITWHVSLSGTGQLWDVKWDRYRNIFIAVGTNQTNAVDFNESVNALSIISSDGENWTAYDLPGIEYSNLYAVSVSPSLIVASGYTGAGGDVILTSSDGIVWTRYYSFSPWGDFKSHSIANNGSSTFVLVGEMGLFFGSPGMIVSTDGINFYGSDIVNSLSGSSLWDVIYANSLFVAVGGYNILVSSDGVTWNLIMPNLDVDLRSVTWDGKLFIAVGTNANTGNTYIITSPDGLTWTEATIPTVSGVLLDVTSALITQ